MKNDRLRGCLIAMSFFEESVSSNCRPRYLCKKVICEWGPCISTHTHTCTFPFEGMGVPFGPVVSDLCAPITQVSQWVTTKKTVGSCGFAQREPHQSVTMGGYFISPFMRVSHTYPVCVWSQSAHRSGVNTLFPPCSVRVAGGPVHFFHFLSLCRGGRQQHAW